LAAAQLEKSLQFTAALGGGPGGGPDAGSVRRSEAVD
jgi:hypothetical protein